MKNLITLFILILFSATLAAQEPVAFQQLSSLSPRYYDKVSDKLGALEKQLDRKTEKYLRKIAREEKKIYQKLLQKDSTKAGALMGNIKENYTNLQSQAKAKMQDVSRLSIKV